MSDIRVMLGDTAQRLFDDLSNRDTAARAEAGEWPAKLWSALEEAGLVAASTADSGADLGDLAVILRESGSHASPLPLAESLAAAWVIAAAGLTVPEGPLSVATEGSVQLRRDGEGWRLSGVLHRVGWGAVAKGVALVTAYEGRSYVIVLDPNEAQIASGRNLAAEPRDRLTFDSLVIASDRVAVSGIDANALHQRLLLFRLVQLNGALNRTLELTIQYANERVQFGKPIGKFQAVQQQIAVLASEVAASAAAVAAAVSAAEDGDAAFAVAAASIRVCDAISQGASIAHQVHGAMGVTHEHSLHLYTRRLWAWRDEIGDEFGNARAIGLAAAKAGGEALWFFLTDPSLGDVGS